MDPLLNKYVHWPPELNGAGRVPPVKEKRECVRGLTDRPPETLAGNNRDGSKEERKKKLSAIQLNLTPRGDREGHGRHMYHKYLGSCVCCQVAKSPRGNEEWSRSSQPIVSYVG